MRSCCVVLGDQDGWGTNGLSKAESILGTGMSQNLSRGRRHACEFNLPLNDPNYDAALQYWKVQIDESYEWELKRRYITDVSGQVTIDGNTQPGGRANAPKIMVNTNRDNLPTFGVSLEVRTSNNVIRNLGFIGGGQIILYEGNNLVENNWMGLKANGSGLSLASTASTQAARSLARGGIILPNEDSDNNIIRGNRIIGAFERAIRITSGGDNNLIEANYIGMDSQGHVPAPHDTGVNCARELDYNASLWYGGRGIQVTGDNNTVTNNRLVGLHVPQSTNDTPPITMEIAGVGNTVTLNVIGRDLAGKDAGVCGQGMLLQGTELLVENNLIVHTRNGFDPGDDGTDFDSAILTQSFAAGSGRWITVRKNMVIDAGAATHPDHVYRFASPGVPVELRKFNPAKVSGINGTSVTGTQGDDAVLPGPTTISAACPNCRIYLYADDLDGRIEAKEFLSEATADASGNWTATLSRSLTADEGLRTQSMAMANGVIHFYGAGTTSKLSDYLYTKRVFGLVIDFGTSQSPKSTRPLTTHWCPSRPGHQALRNNFASSLLLRTWLPMTGRRVRRPTLFSLWRKARRENSAASRLLGSTSLRFALHGWQRGLWPSSCSTIAARPRKLLRKSTGSRYR